MTTNEQVLEAYAKEGQVFHPMVVKGLLSTKKAKNEVQREVKE